MEEFSIFNIFTLLGGLAFFLYGMNVMSTGLEKLTGGKLEVALKKMTENKLKAILLGMGVTVAIQSSSAMTVMLVGFVNSGIMTLEQTIGVCFGSNIGTTVTGLLASLESLNISLYLSLLVFIGVMLAFIKKIKKIANLMTGLGMIFVGLKLMSSACNDDSIKDFMAEMLEPV